MGLFNILFHNCKTLKSDIAFSRDLNSIYAEPGMEHATFLREASSVLGYYIDEADLSKDLQNIYGCDELEVLELIQIAEAVWNVTLFPDPFQSEDAQRAAQDFRTLSEIVEAAKANRYM